MERELEWSGMQFDVQLLASHFQQLSKGVTLSSVVVLSCLCLGVATFSALYESIVASKKYLREVQKRTDESVYVKTRRCKLESDAWVPVRAKRNIVLLSGRRKISIDLNKVWYRTRFHLLQTFLHLLRLILGFLILGIILQYSGWIAVGALLASGVGHYLIGVIVFGRYLIISRKCCRRWFEKLIHDYRKL